MELKDIMKQRRETLSLTQQDLAEMAQVGLATIKDIERGKGNPALSTVKKIRRIGQKFLLVISMLIAFFSATAQNANNSEHLKFLGISLHGSIDNFTNQMRMKGYYVNPSSKNFPAGMRFFDVPLFGMESMAMVYYDTETKNVFDASIVFSSFDLNELKPIYDTYKNEIPNKWTKGHDFAAQIDRFMDMPMWRFSITNSKTKDLIGKIYIYYSTIPADEEFDTIYQLFIRYRDHEALPFVEQYQDLF